MCETLFGKGEVLLGRACDIYVGVVDHAIDGAALIRLDGDTRRDVAIFIGDVSAYAVAAVLTMLERIVGEGVAAHRFECGVECLDGARGSLLGFRGLRGGVDEARDEGEREEQERQTDHQKARAAEPGELHAVGVRNCGRGPAHAMHGVEKAVCGHGGAGDFQPRVQGVEVVVVQGVDQAPRGCHADAARDGRVRPDVRVAADGLTLELLPMGAAKPTPGDHTAGDAHRALGDHEGGHGDQLQVSKAFGAQSDVVDHHEQDCESAREKQGDQGIPGCLGEQVIALNQLCIACAEHGPSRV